MSANPAEVGVTAWKRQLDVALQVAEAIVEGAEKAREIQLAAAVETHAWLEATRKSLAAAPAVTDLAALQSKLATENLGKMAQYWSRLAANTRETQGRIFKLLLESSAAASLLSAGTPAAASQDALSMIDAGYRQWLEAVKRLYSATPTT
jgi:hypothetical protein